MRAMMVCLIYINIHDKVTISNLSLCSKLNITANKIVGSPELN